MPSLRVFSDPLGGLFFGGETFDYFRLAIGPENIDHPAQSGIFSRHENGPIFGHPANVRLRRPGSSQLSCHIYRLDALRRRGTRQSGSSKAALKCRSCKKGRYAPPGAHDQTYRDARDPPYVSGCIRTRSVEPLGASRFNHDTPMAVVDWQGRRHFAFGERPREASS